MVSHEFSIYTGMVGRRWKAFGQRKTVPKSPTHLMASPFVTSIINQVLRWIWSSCQLHLMFMLRYIIYS